MTTVYKKYILRLQTKKEEITMRYIAKIIPLKNMNMIVTQKHY